MILVNSLFGHFDEIYYNIPGEVQVKEVMLQSREWLKKYDKADIPYVKYP